MNIAIVDPLNFRAPPNPTKENDSQFCVVQGAGSMPLVYLQVEDSALVLTPDIEARLKARNTPDINKFYYLVFNVLGYNEPHIM